MAAAMIGGGCQADDNGFLTTGGMEIPSVPDFYKPLSLRLCRILDSKGPSEVNRKFYMETSVSGEIVHSYMKRKRNECLYIFGSQAEGTRTDGLNSDIDFVHCIECYEVFQSIRDIPLSQLLLIQDSNTKPGYCKLQLVLKGIPISRSTMPQLPEGFQFDCNGRVVEAASLRFQSATGKVYTADGPALRRPATSWIPSRDYVKAYRCRSWPDDASKWLCRERKYGWPSQDLIEKMKKLGFFVVKVGHPHSSEKDLEWRISLSLQERLLIYSLNSTQVKCYILLKMVKKDYINKKLGEDVITSYHCKTCLFYMIENTPSDLWQPKNLLACLQGCLKCLYRWVKNGSCPNYFIQEENMFEGRIDDELRIKLETICFVLQTADCGFLLIIQCDDVAKRMANSALSVTATLDSGIEAEQRLLYCFEQMYHGPLSSIIACQYVQNSSPTEAIRDIFGCVYDLSHAVPVTEHTNVEIRNAACVALPYLEISLIAIIIVNKVELGEAETVVDLLLSSKWQELSNRSDRFSAKLKQATFMYMVGQYEASLKVLKPLVNNLSSLQISFCECRNAPNGLITVDPKDIPLDEIRTSHYVPCIRFTSFEKTLIPTALAYELLKSVHMPRAQFNDCDDISDADCVMVDGKILLWFLIFLLRKATGTQATGLVIEEMEWVLNTDLNLRHKETAMNLIGWCCKQEGNIGKAFAYFFLSLAQLKRHNAAFWHVLCTVSEMISNKTLTNANKI